VVSARPHVLYLTPIFGYPPLGGPRLRTYTTLQALTQCADVSLYVWQQPDVKDAAAARAHMLELCRDVTWVDPPPAPSTWRRLAGHALGPARPLARVLAARVRRSSVDADAADPPDPSALLEPLTQRVAEDAVDIVWLGFGGISYPLVALKARTGRWLVLETESVWSRFLLRELPFEPDPTRRKAIEAAGTAKADEERRYASVPDVTTAVSEVDAAYFRSLSTEPDRVMRLSNVIDVASYNRPTDSPRLQTPAICLPGTLAPGTANVDAALWLLDEIMPSVWRRLPQLHLYLVGRDPPIELRRRVDQHVHVTGEVTSTVPFLHQSLATVVPLRWESGTRFKILEAFACRSPVISTTLGAEGLDVVDGQHLLLADGAEEFAEAIVTLTTDPTRGQRLTGPAYELVSSAYDVSTAERQIRQILERLASAAS
jgi:glycosyltransferase involved in cell wall biosynthesis